MRAASRVGAVGLLVTALACAAPRESDRLWARIAELARQNVKLTRQVEALTAPPQPSSLPPGSICCSRLNQPAIDAHVVEAKRSLDLVILDRGSRDGVAVGLVLNVYSGSQYKGEARVADVQDATCWATVVSEASPIERDDCATTRDVMECSVVPPPSPSAQRIAELERENAEMRGMIKELNMKVRELCLRLYGSFFGTEVVPSQPRIDGHVLDVNRDQKLVVLDKGRRDGVELGYVFDVYLGSKYKGQVRITDVQEATCSGVILSQANPFAGGDSATTQL